MDWFRSPAAGRGLLAALGLAFATQACASDTPYLFGDWNGERTRLAEQGIAFDAGYTSEIGHNFTGGTRRLTRYADQWRAGAEFDLDKLLGWKGGSFQVMFTQRDGRDLGSDAQIGNNQLLQEIYGRGQTLRLTLFAFRQTFLDGKLEWRAGRLPVGGDFAGFPCDFQNLTFCGAVPGNIVGDYWVNWPASQWATWLKYDTPGDTYVKLGAYQINANYIDDRWARRNGWKLNNPSGTTGALIPLEFGWTPMNEGLPGTYKIGGWYNNAGGNDLYLDAEREPLASSGGEALQRRSRYGGYLSMRQQASGDAVGKGVTVFFNYTQADAYTSLTDRQIAMGFTYQGPFQRARDMAGFAVGATHASSRLTRYQRLYNRLHPGEAGVVQHGYEYAAEVFYRWAPLPALSLQPNLQYVRHPGSHRDNRHAFVFGMRTSIDF